MEAMNFGFLDKSSVFIQFICRLDKDKKPGKCDFAKIQIADYPQGSICDYQNLGYCENPNAQLEAAKLFLCKTELDVSIATKIEFICRAITVKMVPNSMYDCGCRIIYGNHANCEHLRRSNHHCLNLNNQEAAIRKLLSN